MGSYPKEKEKQICKYSRRRSLQVCLRKIPYKSSGLLYINRL